MLISKTRLEALSEGVYAVALTLLALDLKLGALTGATDATLAAALVELVPRVLIWMLSFWVIVLFWLAQNRGLHLYGALDKRAVEIELAQLALITLLPFTSSLMAEHGSLGTAALVYSTHLALLAALSWQRMARLQRNASIRSAEVYDPAVVTQQVRRARWVTLCALVAVALAWWVPAWNMLAMMGVALPWRGPQPKPAA